MSTEDLETKAWKAVLAIESRLTDTNNILHDLNMKLSHIIKSKRDYHDIYYGMLKGNDYQK